MAKTASRMVGLEPLDRLEEKVRLLVSTIEQMKTAHSKVTDANARLRQELEQARSRLAQTDALNTEVSGLKEERDLIRHRVTDMLEQLEGLNL